MYTMFRTLLTALILSSCAFAHMQMVSPPPLRSPKNKFVTDLKADYSMTAPLSGPAQFPCKGYLTDLGTPSGQSVVTWSTGSSVQLSLEGSATHSGGSCQAALSIDQGKTWHVIHTFQGGCPLAAGSFDFTIPSDTPAGPAVFSWTWYNNVGNREIYQNCASVTIASGSGPAPKTAFKDRPDLFIANLANGCTTVETTDVLIPDPGPDVTKSGSAKQAPASGTCAPVNGIGGRKSSSSGLSDSSGSGSSGSGSESPSAAISVATSSSAMSSAAAPTNSASSGVFITSPAASGFTTSTTSVSPIATSTGTSSGGLVPSVDGQCSGTQTCAGQTLYGPCCSQWGYCGNTDGHCGLGCMAGFGQCGTNSTSSVMTSSSSRMRHVRQFKL